MSSNDLSLDQLKSALPKAFKHRASQELVDKFNTITKDDVMKEAYRDNLLSYTHVLMDGKFRMEQYTDAIRYITHKLMGSTNIDAYIKTFPDRYQNFVASGTSDKDIASYVTSYNKNKLVNIIYEQTMIPTYILNQDIYQKAINKQVSLMMDDTVSPHVQQRAADSLMVNLKPPEVAKVELNVKNKSTEITDELHNSLVKLAAKQKEMIEQGISRPKEVAEAPIHIISVDDEDENNGDSNV